MEHAPACVRMPPSRQRRSAVCWRDSVEQHLGEAEPDRVPGFRTDKRLERLGGRLQCAAKTSAIPRGATMRGSLHSGKPILRPRKALRRHRKTRSRACRAGNVTLPVALAGQHQKMRPAGTICVDPPALSTAPSSVGIRTIGSSARRGSGEKTCGPAASASARRHRRCAGSAVACSPCIAGRVGDDRSPNAAQYVLPGFGPVALGYDLLVNG